MARNLPEPLSAPDRARWAGWIGLLTRYRDLNIVGLDIRDGFPTNFSELEPEYYFPKAQTPIEEPNKLLEAPAWQAFVDLCRSLGNGRLSVLKIRDGRPVAAKGELSARAIHRLRQAAERESRTDFEKASEESPARPDVAGVRPDQSKMLLSV